MKSERELAVELVKLLDGVINKARNALDHAILLLSEMQTVSLPWLMVA